MKKLKFLVWGLFLCFGTISSIAQNGYHYKFRGSNADEYCAASSVVNGIYYTVGNTKSSATSTSNRILLCKYDVNGLVWCRDLYDANNPSHEYYATDIQAGYASLTPSDDTLPNNAPDPDAPGPSMNPIAAQNSNNYLYISGYIKVPNSTVNKMLLLKVNSNGNIIWGHTDFNQNDNNIDEIGVSVESAPNGGAFIVGRSRNVASGTIYVSVARFDAGGNRRWFNRYTNNNSPNGTYIPKQSCIFEEMVTTSPSGIAITGEYNSPTSAVPKSFVMRINHGGIENWRLICPSLVKENADSLGDSGWDIVTDPNTTPGQVTNVNNFVVTGSIGSSTTLSRYMYLFRVNIFGSYTNGFKIGVSGSPDYIFGESVIHAVLNNTTDVVVAGEYKHTSTNELSTYAMKVSPVNGTIGWSVYYPLTQPDRGATESVVEAVGTGYFIATNELTVGNKDAVAILTNNVGKVNKDCESVDFSTSVNNVGSGYLVSSQRYTEAKSQTVSTTREDISGSDQVCKILPLPPFNCTCLSAPVYNYCCCADTFTKYRVCLRFDTAACWPMRNWTITTWFGDSTPGVPISGSNTICHTYRRVGTYVACFEISGQVFYGGAWINCRSVTKCFVITINPINGCMTGLPPCSTAYCPPPSFKNVPASIEDEVKEPYELKVYPNPLDHYKNAQLAFLLPENSQVQIDIMDISGRLIWSKHKLFEAGKQILELPTTDLGNGVYIIHFRTHESVKVLKLDIRR